MDCALSPRVAAAVANTARVKVRLQERHATLQQIADQPAKEFESGLALTDRIELLDR